MRSSWLIVAVVLAVGGGGVMADWPQFQGPTRNNVASASETNLARSWGEGGPKVLWRVTVGEGFAGPAVRDGKVYLLDRVGDDDVLRCLNFADGNELWRRPYSAPGNLDRPGSRGTPTVGEKYIFTIGSFGHFHCFDKQTGKIVWKKNLLDPKEFGGKRPNWGVSQSPVLYKDTVIVAPLGRRVGVAAFERATGKPVWNTPSLGQMGYGSPFITTVGGVEQVVVLANQPRERRQRGRAQSALVSKLIGIDANSGEVLWEYGGWGCSIPIADAVPIGDGRFFITGGYRAGSAMFKVEKRDGKFATDELFKQPMPSGQIHISLLYKDHLYVNSNSNEASDGMVCLDLSGKIKWQTRAKPNFERGNLLLADGMIFNLDGQTGTLHLIDPSPEGYKELARAKLVGRTAERYREERIWAPMALCEGKLILRDKTQMKCIDVRAETGR
jgi:outer membrane protein assembly factor BamB